MNELLMNIDPTFRPNLGKGERIGIEASLEFISEKEEQLIIDEEIAQRLRDLVKVNNKEMKHDNHRKRRRSLSPLHRDTS